MRKNGKVLEFNEEQRRVLVDAWQLWEAFLDLKREEQSLRGGLTWKRVGGKEYLVRLLDSKGNMKSLGPRSPETEKIYLSWRQRKEAFRQRKEAFLERLSLVSKLCKALGLNRVPLVVARIAREMFLRKDIRKRMLILGTNAIYAYEVLAGVLVSSGFLATADLDVLWDARSCLQIAGLARDGFIGLLKKADSSFRIAESPFRAVNKEGFWVDLLKTTPKSLSEIVVSKLTVSPFPEDLLALEAKGTEWLVSCPKVYVVAIGHDGVPVPMVVPDPRAFMLHKLWVARHPNRPAVKKRRDIAQALLVRHLLTKYLPSFPLDQEIVDQELKALPSKLRKLVELAEEQEEDAQNVAVFLPSLGP